MSIKIQITPKELQELEQNGSALFALFKVAMENQNMNRLNLAGDSVKESKKPSSKVCTESTQPSRESSMGSTSFVYCGSQMLKVPAPSVSKPTPMPTIRASIIQAKR